MKQERRQLAERSVLSCMMQIEDVRYACVDRLTPEHFTTQTHRKLFEYMVELSTAGRTCDCLVLAELAKRDSWTITIPDIAEIQGWETTSDPERFIALLEEAYRIDALRATALWMIDEVQKHDVSASVTADQAAAKLFAIGQSTSTKEDGAIGSIVYECIESMDERRNRGGSTSVGTRCGFELVDRCLLGFQAPKLYVFAARPGVGKSAMMMTLALRLARAGSPQAIISCEMSRRELGFRALSIESGVEKTRIKLGLVQPEEQQQVHDAGARLRRLNIDLYHRSGVRPTEVRARARKLKSTMGLEGLWVDYLQIMRANRDVEAAKASREQQVASLSRELKNLAGDLDLYVCALAQLNRALEHRKDKEPVLADLRESGAIENDADAVLFIHREKPDTDDGQSDKPTKSTLIVAKQRDGAVGSFDLLYIPTRTEFVEPSITDNCF